MWTRTRSLMLSRLLTCVFAAGLLAALFFIPRFVAWYKDNSISDGIIKGDISIPMTLMLYTTALLALCAVGALFVLLRCISIGEVFIDTNTACLRIISWVCMLAGCAFFVFGLWRYIFLAAAFFAILLGLILRVLKNVFAAAVDIKSENDLTV